MEQGYHSLIIQRDIRRNEPIVRLIVLIVHLRGVNIFFQSLDHSRIIMSQDIKLQKVMIDGMIVKVRRHDIRCRIIGRMLHRRKGIDLFPQRKNDDTARMLPGTPSDPCTSKHDPVDLTFALTLSPLGKIILHVSERRLIRQRSDGSGPVCLSGTKDDFRVLVGITLIITGEIQVDIRFFIPLKSQERLERNVESVLLKRLAADRARLIRHIPSAASGIGAHLLGIKITVMAVLAVIVRT